MPLRVAMTLSGQRLSPEGAAFAAQLGVRDVVVSLNAPAPASSSRISAYAEGQDVGPPSGDGQAEQPWDRSRLDAIVGMTAAHGLRIAAIENFAPAHWSDVLLDGPRRATQMAGLKRFVRDVGAVGIPVIGYNFSIAGVWGWRRMRAARGGAVTAVFDTSTFDSAAPIPDGEVWNMRYRPGLPEAAPLCVTEDKIWDRLRRFLEELVPVAEEAGVRLAAHPDDPPVGTLRGTARLVNHAAKYDRLLGLVPSSANALEFCLGSLQEMPGTDIYALTRRHARAGHIAYVHFRNVRGQVPQYHETFVDDGDIDMTEIVRILTEEGFDGVMVPDHTPEPDCAAPWHAGMAYAVGWMRALTAHAQHLGPSNRDRTGVRNLLSAVT